MSTAEEETSNSGVFRYSIAALETLVELAPVGNNAYNNSSGGPVDSDIVNVTESGHSSMSQESSVSDYNMYNVGALSSQVYKAFICKWCSMSLDSEDELESHMKTTHPSEYNVFKCQICQLICVDQPALSEHLLSVHVDTYPYFCFDCGKGFKTQSGLDAHMGSRHGLGKQCFTCEICKKSFSRACNLNTHKLSHSRERPFECRLCGAKYKHLRDYKSHSNICRYKVQAMQQGFQHPH